MLSGQQVVIQVYSSDDLNEEFAVQPAKNRSIVVSALTARAGFGKLLRRVEDEQRSLVIEKRGTPTEVLLSRREYVRLSAPEPEVLRLIW